MKPISYGRQEITSEDEKAVLEALRSDYLTQGPLVDKFESEFSRFVDAKHAIAFNNATSALHLANLVLNNSKKKTKVITTPISFVATANSILYAGNEVEFADINPSTFCLDPEKTEDILKQAPEGTYSGLIPVSFAGHPCDIESFHTLAKKYNLWIIEDCCHAPGARIKNASGSWSSVGDGKQADLSVFSFHPVKHIATGEGGMVTTQKSELAEKLYELRSHGITRNKDKFQIPQDGSWYYEMQNLGYNHRMPDINCALGISQLKRIQSNLERRQLIAKKYQTALRDLPLQIPQPSADVYHAYHLFIVLCKRRLELYNFLKAKQIHCQIHYIPIHQQPFYIDRYGKQTFPASEFYYNKTISLPMYHSMTDTEQEYVIEQIHRFYES
jgi:UDP-4-amino-4,6-dideoxy-N-acetyl-beta-L-altrosamine transaminase